MARVYKRGNNWYYRIRIIKDKKIIFEKNGGGFSSKKDADFESKKIETEYYQGKKTNILNTTFPEYFKKWINLYKMGANSARSDNFYTSAIHKADKLFNNIYLSELSRSTYQDKINTLAQTLAKATVSKYHKTFKSCLSYAVEEGLFNFNPADRIVVKGNPKKEKAQDEKYINFNEVIKLRNALLDEHYKISHTSRNICLIAIETGMRFSEIVAMTWDRINFKNKTIKIDRSWDYTNAQNFIPTKNRQTRFIKMTPNTIELLKNIKVWQIQLNLYTKNNFVNVDSDNKLITNNAVNKTLEKACKRANIERITLHGLRHTHGSILFYKGYSIMYISQRLGHADISTTQKIYLHLLLELEQQEDTKIIDGIF